MPSKNQIIGALVVLNLVLVCAVLAGAVHGRVALAQRQPMSTSNYIAIAAEIQSSYDALYVLDLNARRLNVMVPTHGGKPTLQLAASRDLKRDFRVKVQP